MLLIAAVAWVAVVIQARGMMAIGGTMGLGLLAFVPLWTLMMAAMMLPSVAPVAVLYERAVSDNRILRLAMFAAGIFLILGLYQVSPIKDRCLSHCRSPFSLLMHYANFHGPLRDLRAGTHHALYCVGCCWALMLVLVVAGIMNLLVMVVLAAVILIEKYWSRGPAFSRVVAAAAVVLAVAAVWVPALSPGLGG